MLRVNPNIYHDTEITYTVKVTLRQWSYSGVFGVYVRGNVAGYDVLQAAISAFMVGHHNNEQGCATVTLSNPSGDKLDLALVDESELEPLVYGIEVLQIKRSDEE